MLCTNKPILRIIKQINSLTAHNKINYLKSLLSGSLNIFLKFSNKWEVILTFKRTIICTSAILENKKTVLRLH